jgi:hypothetical protein
MKIEIELSENELKKLSELTEVEIDIDKLYDEDVSYAIGVLINNC